jgi:5-hydroxyisourate hydrolase-like protein (transthyretin family)
MEVLAAEHRTTSLDPSGRGAVGEYYAFRNVARGRMEVSVEASEPGRGFLLIEGAGPARLLSHLAAFNQRVGQRIGLVARVYDREKGTNALGGGAVVTALLRVTTPDGELRTTAMLDDGLHADGQAGDGVYGADFAADRAGHYNAQVVVTGQDGSGSEFLRTAEHPVPVVDDAVTINRQTTTSALVGEQRVRIRLGVAGSTAAGHYRVIGEVWGTSAGGGWVPVAWIGGMAAIREGALELGLDTRWVELAGAREPFELRNVRIEDPNYFITVTDAGRMPLPMPALPAVSAPVGQIVVDEEMRMGPRPPELAPDSAAEGSVGTNLLVPPAYDEGSGHRLLLVHGYCSTDVWGPVSGEFGSAAAVFFEEKRNWSHDEFAQEILDFGKKVNANSYAVVAHSQGGAAALQLYNTRWSGLDNASTAGSGRLIQSVGTPYHGTNLQGILAAIAGPFDVGCGFNWNLTYLGAELWLAGVPSVSREAVHFYTTSAHEDDWGWDGAPCSKATDLFLDDPEDGVTEMAMGQLQYGTNRGHATEECHTDDMDYPPQTRNASRNANMKFFAAGGCFRLTRKHAGEGSDPVATPGYSTGCPVGRYVANQQIQLQASPWAGSSVTGWVVGSVNDSSTSSTYTVTMPAGDLTVQVNYGLATVNQSLSVSITGNGSVTSSPAGINGCTGTCSASYSSGTLVTLTASAGGGAVFSGWGGGSCWGTGPCQVVMSAAHNVTATFGASSPGTHRLTVQKLGTGSGTVTSSPSGISCGSTCTKSYAAGTPVTLTASAAGGSAFAGWGGACGGTGACPVTMSAARDVTATFSATTVPPSAAGSLIRQTGQNEVFWRQNGYIYHVTAPEILDMMQAAGIPGWSWTSIASVSSLSGLIYGPAFIMSSTSSNDLLIRERGTFEVYWMQNGERRWVACEGALPGAGELGSFANVIEVSSSIIDTVVPDRGLDFGEGCSCTGFDVSPTSLPSNPDSSAGSEVVDVTGRPYGCSGNWTAWDDGGWLSVSSTGSSLSASDKSDPVTVSWTENPSQSSRSSSVTVADRNFPLTQRGAPVPTCTSFDISPNYKSTGPSSGSQSVTITGYPSGCQGKSWVATNGSWVTVTPSSGTGPRSVTVSWTPNTGAAARQETVTIATKTFTVAQGPANQPPAANAGPDQLVGVNALVTLSGGGSSDPDSGPSTLTYAWSQVSGPAVTLAGAVTVSAVFTPPSAGTYVLELRVSDGSAQATDQVTVTAAAGVATYDATLEAPRCASVGSVCDSGTLLVGRSSLGPEANQPNTIHASCADGADGLFHSDESSDRIRVSTLDGASFAGGKVVQVEATVWAWSDPSSDRLEIYRAADANAPAWTLVAALTPAAPGAQTLSATYTLPTGSLQAVRARFRWSGSAGPCGGGTDSYDDHDDLVFAVGAATTQGWISGSVKDAATGEPLADVWVDVYDAGNALVATGTTNSAGAYATTGGLPTGTYFARTWNGADYVDELYDDITCPGGTCTATRGVPIGVTAGGTTSGVDFALVRGGRISGTVRDAASGLPLAGVGVFIFPPSGGYVAYDYTDAAGAYTVTGLPPGTWYARSWDWGDYVDELYDDISCPSWSCGLSGAAPIAVTAGATTTAIDFALARGGGIAGTVTDASTGLPLSGVRVMAYSSGGSYITDGYTGASGAYSISGLPTAAYYTRTSNSLGYVDEVYEDVPCAGGSCTVTSGTLVSVIAGSTTTASFGLTPGGRISGTVTDASTGAPLANVWVHIYSSGGSYVAFTTTNGSGVYTTQGLPAATYRARTSNSIGYVEALYDDLPCPGGVCSVTSGTPITVTVGATTSGVDFALAPGGRISGTVRDAATGLPLAGVYVDVYSAGGSYLTYGYTDGAGAYTTAAALASGTYHAVTWSSLGYVDELYDDVSCPGSGCSVTGGAPIAVTGGTTTGIDFALARGGRISGTVTDAATGLPLSGVTIRIYDTGGGIVDYGSTSGSGAYTTAALPPGTYHARTSNAAGYVDELHDGLPCGGGACSPTSGAAIAVTAGSMVTGIDFALAGGGRLTGTVTDASTGLPVAGVQVAVYSASGSYVAYGYTNSSGAYTTGTGLPSGTYYARTSNSQGYLEEVYDDAPCPDGLCTATAGTPIGVTAGATTSGIDFALARGGRISGTVTDATTGVPLSGVTVSIRNSSGVQVASGSTNSSGVYTTGSGLPSGTYRARTRNQAGYVDEVYNAISCPGSSCATTSGAPIGVTAGSTTTGISFALAQGGRIGGAVTGAATGKGVSGVSVMIHDSSGGYVTSATTNASGLYASPGLPPAAYRLRTSNSLGYVDELHDGLPCAGGLCTVTDGAPVATTAGATTSGIDFALASGGRISGTVTDAATGSPLAGVQVSVLDSGGRSLGSGTTNDAGAYTTSTGLPSGTYHARTTARGYLDELYQDVPCPGGSCTVTSGTPLPVTAGSTTPAVDFALSQAPPQTNDEIAGATPVSNLPYHTIEDTRSATTNPSDPVHGCATGTQDANSVWFRYVATFTGTVRVNTFNSNYDTVLTAYPGTTSVGPELACDDDTSAQQSEIAFDVVSGESYLIEVSDYGTPNGGTLILEVAPAPPAVTTGFATGVGPYEATLVGWVNPGGTSTSTAFAYGTTTDYGATMAAQTLTGPTTQAISAAVTSLACATTYHFRALGTNGGGTVSGADVTFSTAACPPPTLSVSDATVTEGNAGTAAATFTLSLSKASAQAVTVSYTTADDTATAGTDYLTTFGPLTIPAGSLSRTVSITVLGDRDHERDEAFFLDLANPTNATLSDARGVGTIANDDPMPTLSIGDVTVRRAASGSTSALLPVTLSGVTYQTVAVAYATVGGTAIAGTDYLATSGTMSFPPGVTAGTLDVAVNGSSTVEARTFFVDLGSPVNATIADGRGQATLIAEGHGFYTVTPCRSVDTRIPAPGAPLAAGVPRAFVIAGTCGIPATARAVSLNVTVTGGTSNGNVRVYAPGSAIPTTSTVNFAAGLTRANNAISPLGSNGDLAVLLSPAGAAHVVVDVNGYFE